MANGNGHRKGGRRGRLSIEALDGARRVYVDTGDITAAAASAGATVGAVQAHCEIGKWDEQRATKRAAEDAELVADERQKGEARRKANAQHYKWAQDIVGAFMGARLATLKTDLADCSIGDAARSTKGAMEALKIAQFMQRLVLEMNTDRVATESVGEMMGALRAEMLRTGEVEDLDGDGTATDSGDDPSVGARGRNAAPQGTA
uniref:Uncharacterized protein n=1 Tax=viral metagenome TaxID=1070528 RepID=A0A6H1ZH27_9ZZZZ